jgi:hypothetical protein
MRVLARLLTRDTVRSAMFELPSWLQPRRSRVDVYFMLRILDCTIEQGSAMSHATSSHALVDRPQVGKGDAALSPDRARLQRPLIEDPSSSTGCD